MKIIESPSVFLIGNTSVDYDEIERYLSHINVSDWTTDAQSDIEFLCEFYGRSCYESWNTEKNLNVSRIRQGNEGYLKNIIRSGHGSVLEHGWLNWKIADVSRVFTHELVRHRVGTAISQQSQRYVRLRNKGFWIPHDMEEILTTNAGSLTMKDVEEGKQIMIESVNYLEEQMGRLEDIFHLNDKKTNFDVKKRLTTIVRRIAPEGMSTDIGWSCNIRTLRHLLELRTSRHSEEEIRTVFGLIGEKVIEKYPNLFGDYKIEMVNGLSEFTTENMKI